MGAKSTTCKHHRYSGISRNGWHCIGLVLVAVLILGVLTANHFLVSSSLPIFTIKNLPISSNNAQRLPNSSSAVGRIQVRNPSSVYDFAVLVVEYALARYEPVNAKGFLPPVHLSQQEAKVIHAAGFAYDPNKAELPSSTQVGGPESVMPRVPEGERDYDNGFVVGMKVTVRVEVGFIKWREHYAVGCCLRVSNTTRDSNVDSSVCNNFLY